MHKNLPSSDLFLGASLPEFPNHTMTEWIGAGSNGHVFLGYRPDTESKLAFKFVPTENLPNDRRQEKTYLNEAKKANILENSCVVQCVDVVPWFHESLGKQFVVFVSQYVSGLSLKKYTKQNRADISIGFIESFLGTMLGLLYELGRRGMEHGDLHSGNVLVSQSEYDISAATTFRVTDFGITEVTGTRHRSDYLFVAEILRDLLECIDYQEQTSRDRYVFDVLRSSFLGRHLIETDTLADPLARNPKELANVLSKIDDAYREAFKVHTSSQMITPFDYPNCEQMGSSHLLLKNLYSDQLLGLAEIRSRSNLVLTGPRGCGKTTVFRALSLDYATSVDADDPSSIDFVGVYYRCDDLYFSFPRYEKPSRLEAIDIPMHFIVVSLIVEALKNLRAWGKQYFETEFLQKEPDLARRIWKLVGVQPPNSPDGNRFSALITKLTKQRARAAKKQRVCHDPNQPISGYCGPMTLFEFCAELRSTLSFLKDRPFFFFVDDYSTPKITQPLQQNLNRLFMHRSPDVFFKLSTESPISFERGDIDGKQYVEEREFDLLNLGLRYLQHTGGQVQIFLEDLFARRFREVKDFPCNSLIDLLGDYARNENELARTFRQRKGRSSYSGVQTITAMCSGDIHYMIRLVGRMVGDAGGVGQLGESSDVPHISLDRQSKTIRSAAGDFMESVRNLPRHGKALALIVSAFGNVATSYMRHRDATNEKGSPPHQASRIEPYEPLNLTSDAQGLLNELVRFSILLMDPRGKSRRGQVVPRFYLRRYLIPHFNLTFSRRDSIQLENRDIELLLTNPQKFEEQHRMRGADKFDSVGQQDFFDNGDHE